MSKMLISGLYEEQLAQLEALEISEGEQRGVEIDEVDFIACLNFKQRGAIISILQKKGLNDVQILLNSDEIKKRAEIKLQEMAPEEREKRRFAMRERDRDVSIANFRDDFPRVLSGISAEALFVNNHGTILEFYPDLNQLLQHHSDFLIVEYPSGSKSIVNIKAAKWIISKNPDLFPPEAHSDTVNWLKKAEGWERGGNETQDIRYGLLSGFDRISTQLYQQRDKIVAKMAYFELERFYGEANELTSNGQKDQAKTLLQGLKNPQTGLVLLTEEEINVIINATRYVGKLNCVIFDEMAQQRIDQDIEERIAHCGIKLSDELQKCMQEMKISNES